MPPGGMIGRMLAMLLNAPRDSRPIPFGADHRAFHGYTLYTESNIAADIQVASGVRLLDN